MDAAQKQPRSPFVRWTSLNSPSLLSARHIIFLSSFIYISDPNISLPPNYPLAPLLIYTMSASSSSTALFSPISGPSKTPTTQAVTFAYASSTLSSPSSTPAPSRCSSPTRSITSTTGRTRRNPIRDNALVAAPVFF